MTAPPEERVVGRSRELRLLHAAARGAAAGQPSTVLVSGEAGMGKTSLVRAAVDSLATGAVVGWGIGRPGRAAPGFWPWTQVLEGLVAEVGVDAALVAAGDDRADLAVLARGLGASAPPAGDPERRRLLLLDAVVRWLQRLARGRDVVVVLDDLQWADESTLDLLNLVVAARGPAQLLVIGAYRHDELDARAADRISSLSLHTEHVALRGLDVRGIEQLLAPALGPEPARDLAPRLHRRTGGHPLFARELARLPADGELPTAVTSTLARRIDTLPTATHQALEAGAVLGDRLLPDVLSEVTGVTPAQVLDDLAPAVEAGVLRLDRSQEIRFSHDLFRETVHGRLTPSRLAELHVRTGEALVARRSRGAEVPAGDLARQFARAGAAGNPAATIGWAREAAREDLGRGAFTEAAEHLRRAREAVVDAGQVLDTSRLVDVLLEEAEAEARAGRPDAARERLASARSTAPDPSRLVHTALALQRLGSRFATPREEVVERLEQARVTISGRDDALEARVTAALSRELRHSVAQERHDALRLSDEALALARRSGDDEALAACLLARHDALWRPGTGEQRSALGRSIEQVAARLGDTDRLVEGLLLQANGLLESGSPAFRPVLDRWFGLLEARDEPRDRYLVLTRRAFLALLEGDGDRAEALMHEAALLGERLHEPDTGNVLMSQRVALARLRDDPHELATLAEDAVAWWTGAPVLAHAVAAGARAAAGDLDAAARELAMLSAAGGWRSEESYLRSVLVVELAGAASALHETVLCRLLLADLRPITTACGVNGALVAFAGPFTHPAGLLAAELGDLDGARELLTASVVTARALGAAVWVRDSQAALTGLAPPEAGTVAPVGLFSRDGSVWTVRLGSEQARLPHAKGLSDLAVLIRCRDAGVPALQLATGDQHTAQQADRSASAEPVIDLQALRAYRRRLDALTEEIELARTDHDAATLGRLSDEREQLLAQVRSSTGLAGRLRTAANVPAERARKAVSQRIRDTIRHLSAVAPELSAHLDRSVRTGLRCTYSPTGADAEVRWQVET